MVAEVRGGVGLMAAIDLEPSAIESNPGIIAAWYKATRDPGVIVRQLAHGLGVAPPLTITTEQLKLIGDGLDRGLMAVCAA